MAGNGYDRIAYAHQIENGKKIYASTFKTTRDPSRGARGPAHEHARGLGLTGVGAGKSPSSRTAQTAILI